MSTVDQKALVVVQPSKREDVNTRRKHGVDSSVSLSPSPKEKRRSTVTAKPVLPSLMRRCFVVGARREKLTHAESKSCLYTVLRYACAPQRLTHQNQLALLFARFSAPKCSLTQKTVGFTH